MMKRGNGLGSSMGIELGNGLMRTILLPLQGNRAGHAGQAAEHRTVSPKIRTLGNPAIVV